MLDLVKKISYKSKLILTDKANNVLKHEERCVRYQVKISFEKLKLIFKAFNLNE